VVTDSEKEIGRKFEAKLLQIVRRYQEDAAAFDMSASVFNHTMGMDSLDLAEVFSWVEQQFGISPMDDDGLTFATWNNLASWVYKHLRGNSSS
jgi:acyl carrier protein